MTKSNVAKLEREWSHQRPDLDAQVVATAMRLQMLSKILNDAAAKALARLDLEWWEYDTLSTIRRSGEPYEMFATDLARSNLLSTGAMTNRLDGLEARDLIERRADPSDRRRVIICLTKSGLRLIDRAADLRFTSADRILQSLTDDERRTFDQILDKLLGPAGKDR